MNLRRRQDVQQGRCRGRVRSITSSSPWTSLCFQFPLISALEVCGPGAAPDGPAPGVRGLVNGHERKAYLGTDTPIHESSRPRLKTLGAQLRAGTDGLRDQNQVA